MYFFDKKVIYLVWNVEDGQVKGVGTVRFLVVDQICRIEITITNCGTVTGTYPIYLLSGDMRSIFGEITLSSGRGEFYLKCDTDMLGDQKFRYKNITGILIDLKTEGTLEQRWLPESIEDLETTLPKQSERKIAKNPVEAKVSQPSNSKKEIGIHSNKWHQLCTIYPIVHPFEEGRAYLSIEPRDFVILQEQYQPLVNNSFLLHGFYHYKYLLLGRRKQGRGYEYYLGVPGIYYEKEKAAAIYYGFERFESLKSPAKEGDFGYYMKRVQI